MGKAFIFFFLLFSCFLSAQKMEWSNYRKLNWSNFKAPQNFKSSADNSAAYTYCGISYHVTKSSLPNGNVTVRVAAIFFEEKSWKKNENPGDYLLKHEQLHFDIAEVFARKIRKMVKEKIRNSQDFDRYFQKEYQSIYSEYQQFQNAYDRDTKHSIIPEKQEAYNRMVSQMLWELSDYQ